MPSRHDTLTRKAKVSTHHATRSTPSTDPEQTVLVVDEDADLRRSVAQWLRQAGYCVALLAAAGECVASLSLSTPSVVILGPTAHDTGQRSGRAATLARIKAYHRLLPVIVLTDRRSLDWGPEAVHRGGYDFLVKPLHRDKLLTVVKNAAAHHRAALRVAELERCARGAEFPGIVGDSFAMRAVLCRIERLAATDVNVLIRGDRGTGKSTIARLIHERSRRRNGPFVVLKGASVARHADPSGLPGAISSSGRVTAGWFERANRGTLFIDDVTELSKPVQLSLAQALASRRFDLRGEDSQPIEFRLLAASHRGTDPSDDDEPESDGLIAGLEKTLGASVLRLPSLQDRLADLPLLLSHLLERHGSQNDRRPPAIDPAALAVLLNETWPNNLHDLEVVVQHALHVCDGEVIKPTDLVSPARATMATSRQPLHTDMPLNGERFGGDRPWHPALCRNSAEALPLMDAGLTMAEIERRAIEMAMERCASNRALVAQQLGIGRTTLYRKLKSYGWG